MKTDQSITTAQVAIVQPAIIFGGRLQVIIGMIQALNGLGIVPHVVTSRLAIDPTEVVNHYGIEIQAIWRVEPLRYQWPNELYTACFNIGLRRFSKQYDLIINTSNSLLFLPQRARMLTYMFYPRKSRISAPVADIHRQDAPRIRFWTRRGLYRFGLRFLYRLSKPHPNHDVIAMTEFTKEAMVHAYPNLAHQEVPLVYPPVPLRQFKLPPGNRPPVVTTVGRFDPAKRQLDQIELAARLPILDFHIIGFVHNHAYFELCQAQAAKQQLCNVRLYPNVGSDKLQTLLQSSRYFLHTTINEPFGITAVQAVAAGNVPLVHDSGGQRETIPNIDLRYRSLDDVVAKIERLESMDLQGRLSLITDLQEHIQRFDEGIFVQKMRHIFSVFLN
jgi:glycosyltransferase involved in cell wall biosynthesis